MKKIKCEYCKNSIDLETDKKCPNCGASYLDNKDYLKIKEKEEYYEERNKDLELETREIINDTTKTALNSFKSTRIIVIFIFVAVFLIIGFVAIQIISAGNHTRNSINNINKTEEIKLKDVYTTTKPQKIKVNKDEFAEGEKYKVKIDKYETFESINKVTKPRNGYKFIAFHLLVNNVTEEEIWFSDNISCIYNEISQNKKTDLSNHPEVAYKISSGVTEEGYAVFEVPKNASVFDIQIGDNIIIHIEN